ncbi:MAG: transcription elongation factor GreA [Spirochaetota bacterium]
MTVDTVQKITELLNEEKWTRATLNNYIIKNFTDLDTLIHSAKKNNEIEELRNIVAEHLTHTPNSIIALYVLGKLNFEEDSIDEGHIQKLINLFLENRRFNIVEFLANEILKHTENKYALEALSKCIVDENREEELISVWERIVKIDYDEAELTKKIAVIKEKKSLIEEAIDYYKKALLRYLKKGMYNPMEEIWLKLIELVPEDLNFFLSTEKRIAETIGVEKSAFLLSFLVPYYKDKGEYDIAIEILHKILNYNTKDREAREELIECYTEKYSKHSYLEEYLEKSGLNDYSVDIQEAIKVFESHIAFDVGCYVYHRTWGIGRCTDIKDETLIIDFSDRPNHRMSLEMALNCLQILPEDHLWLLKIKDPDGLRKLVLEDVEEGLKLLIKSKNNQATVKDFKEELLKGILTKKEWARWWNKAKTVLKRNPYFGTIPDSTDIYFIRKKPIEYDEDIYNRFKTEKSFDRRFELFNDFISHGDIDSEYFEDMLNYFTNFISSPANINENTLKSYLMLKNLKKMYSYIPVEFPFDFDMFLTNLKDIHLYLTTLPDNDLKKSFLINIKRSTENWPEIFIKGFYTCPMKFIIDELISEGYADLVNETIKNIISHYREYSDLFIWISKNLIVKQPASHIQMNFEQLIMGLTHLLEISNRELINERNVVANRKLFNTIVDILFKDNLLIDYIKTSDKTKVKRLIPTIFNIDELKDEYVIKTRFAIKTTFPDIIFDDEIENVEGAKQLIVTQRSYELKQNELKYLTEVEIPKNSKEIGEAMERGDLRENAEYKFALEKQEFLKHQIKTLRESLHRSQILKAEDIKTNVVSIGTTITLTSIDEDKTEKITILGPWESEPSKKIISYTSPLGENLLNRSVGEIVELGNKNNKKRYKILKIEKAPI